MRRPLLLAAGATLTIAGCGSGDEVKVKPIAANDPATLQCRQFKTPRKETCESAFFACAENRAEIVDDIDRGRRPARRTIVTEYAKSYWSDWDEPTREAARKGCRGGLPR